MTQKDIVMRFLEKRYFEDPNGFISLLADIFLMTPQQKSAYFGQYAQAVYQANAAELAIIDDKYEELKAAEESKLQLENQVIASILNP